MAEDYHSGSYPELAGSEQDAKQHPENSPEVSNFDMFVAGAKDFAQDVKDVWSGNMHGPNFGNRKKVLDGR